MEGPCRADPHILFCPISAINSLIVQHFQDDPKTIASTSTTALILISKLEVPHQPSKT